MNQGQEDGLSEATPSTPTPESPESKEIFPPIMLFGSEEEYDLLDLRPVLVESSREEEPAPKDSSAQESADSSKSTEETPEETVSVEKDSGQPKGNESGQQTSSSKTPAGKAKQTAST